MTLLDDIDACDAPAEAKASARRFVEGLTERQTAKVSVTASKRRPDETGWLVLASDSGDLQFQYDGLCMVDIVDADFTTRDVAELLTGVKGGGDDDDVQVGSPSKTVTPENALGMLVEKLRADGWTVLPPGVEQGDGWVSVGERLPEERDDQQPDCSVDVLMACNGRVLRGYYDHAFKAWYDHCGPGNCRDVTHWRPLPEPPGGGE